MHNILQQILEFFGNGFCHQYSERSFESGGLLFSVCARDTGIYLGFVITLLVVVILCRQYKIKPAGMLPVWALVISVLLIVPMIVDGVSSYLDLRESINLIRYLTGYLAGMGVALVASGGILSIWPAANNEERAINTPPQFAAVITASAIIGAAFYLLYPFMGVVSPFFALLTLWLAVAIVNLLAVSATRRWPRQPDARKARIKAMLLCLLAALIEMALLSLLVSALYELFPWYVHP